MSWGVDLKKQQHVSSLIYKMESLFFISVFV